MKKNLLYNTALYIRLSREDGDKEESFSIGNQRKLLESYVASNRELIYYKEYVDDGYSGTNFDRPAFCQMIRDVELGNVNCVIVKDLSRFGRDYIETGKYLERYFPERGIRFISIADDIDSERQVYDMLLPIKNIFNEQYARDISKKVRTAMSAKQRAGEFVGAFPSYGYRKDAKNKNHLVPDPCAAAVVRRIFDLYIEGYGKNSIAKILNEEGIMCPSEYKKANGEHYRNSRKLNSTSYWTYSTIHKILQNEMYLGNMVQGKKTQWMNGRQKAMDKEDWVIVPGTHEAIVTRETWEKTQILLRRRARMPEFAGKAGTFAGFLKCGECGRALVKKGGKNIYYCCGTYVRAGKNFCTPHKILEQMLEKIMEEELEGLIKEVQPTKEWILSCLEEVKQAEQEMIGEEEAERKQAEMELQNCEMRRRELYEDYKEELLTKEEYLQYREEVEKKQNLCKMRLRTNNGDKESAEILEVLKTPWIQGALCGKWIGKISRSVLAEVLERIEVKEEGIVKLVFRTAQ